MLINEFFANREVLVTGATGFLGKALVEKLLRDCPQIKVFYVLLRTKKSLTTDERLEQLKKDKVFDCIREKCPEVLAKLHAIPGNTNQKRLGIQDSDLKLLQNVSVIFHMAANVKFDDSLQSSILSNTRGTHELVKIAENLKNLVVFMHCSTAYCNPFEDVVEEKVYPLAVDWRKSIEIAETYDEHTLNALFYKYAGFYPNTYCFTKNLSEQLIKEYSKKLPIVLFRPSIVTCAHKEPTAGWIDNLNGPIAAAVGLCVGVLPVTYVGKDIKLDEVPVDFVTKLTIVATFKRGLQFLRKEPVPNDLEVINCSSGDIYEISMKAAIGVFCNATLKNPMENKIWDYGGKKLTACYYDFLLQILFMSMPLAIVLDVILRVMDRKPMMVQMTRRVVHAAKATYFFSTRQYQICNQNLMNLENFIPQNEIATYGVQSDINLNIVSYMENYVRGVKYYLFNQPKEVTPAAKRRAKILYVANKSIKVITTTLFIIFSWSVVKKLF